MPVPNRATFRIEKEQELAAMQIPQDKIDRWWGEPCHVLDGDTPQQALDERRFDDVDVAIASIRNATYG